MLLEKFRDLSQTWVAKLLLVLIMVPFALFGINYYFNQGSSGADVVAKVAGQSITLSEFNQTLKSQLEQSPDNSSVTDSQQLRFSVLQALSIRHVMQGYAEDIHLQVPNQLLASDIAQIPYFMDNGQFSPKKYEALLRDRGMTPVRFENAVRADLAVGLVRDTFSATQWVPNTSVLAFMRLTGQQRSYATAQLTVKDLAQMPSVSDKEVSAYYQSHKEQFQVPEQVKLNYVVLSMADIVNQSPVTKEEIERFYKDPANAQRWQTKESRRVSHILFSVPSHASQQIKETQLEKAKKTAIYLRAHIKEFAQVAKKESDDSVSAKQGGDLGFFTQGTMVAQFDRAAFALALNQVSDPIETPYGYHILLVTAIKPGKIKSLEEVTPVITAELKKEHAQKHFAEIADQFSNMVYEQSTSLNPVVDKFKLTLETSPWLTPFGSKDASAYLNQPKFLKAIFNAESIKDGRNTQAIEVAPNVLIAARVISHQSAHDRPLSDLKTTIQTMLEREAQDKALTELGQHSVTLLNKGKGQEVEVNWSKELSQSRSEAINHLPQAVVRALYSAPINHFPYYLGVLTDQGYTLLQLNGVQYHDNFSNEKTQQISAALDKNYAQGIVESFIDGVESKKPLRILNQSILNTQSNPS
ncbi:peptidyl-prolyl cis-trans isomerase D [Ferrovum sp. JA12]|uniref:SurA N-terminal domain-containing protein n=1 Tax=Ferrovum sp. JA12 TaxID=1356299 RepID=UPI000703A7ED|nr:SurA N-terminal domain-containing protein [Ferrovum sp. JA12]KRH78494.1 peptidyl-prolyl cis-trans isomerase D [Ferrovum sp. JA12]